MTYEEIDDYNRRRGPDDPFLFTIRIDRRDPDRPIATEDGWSRERRW
jgi:hypothetical protein